MRTLSGIVAEFPFYTRFSTIEDAYDGSSYRPENGRDVFLALTVLSVFGERELP